MSRALLTLLCCFSLLPAHAQRAIDTFRLYFDLGVPALSPGSEKKIDLLVYNDKIINGSSVMIVGYTDYLGSEKKNNNLSMERARNVKNYLVKYGINAANIKMCVGKGEIHRTNMTNKDGSPEDRRVDIVVNNAKESNEHVILTSKGHKDTAKTRRPSGSNAASNLDEVKNLKVGATMLLKNVYFPADRHTIKPESKETLEKLYAVLRQYPGLKISIEGHVCCIKTDVADALDIETFEPTLSLNRARAIYNYLVSRGIDSARLQYAGFGHRKPVVAYEVTDEDTEKNRRVEIRITDNK